MHCRRYDYRYAVVVQSSRPGGGEWHVDKINLIVAKSHWTPCADVYETEDQVIFIVELAGADPEKLEISLYKNALVIEGERRLHQAKTKGKYHIAEIRQGSFCFEFPIEVSIDPDQIETVYENGILSIVLNKT